MAYQKKDPWAESYFQVCSGELDWEIELFSVNLFYFARFDGFDVDAKAKDRSAVNGSPNGTAQRIREVFLAMLDSEMVSSP